MTDPYEGPENVVNGRGTVGESYDCGSRECDRTIGTDSHQADPCAACNTVFHDRCFFTKAHACVAAGLIEERPGYGVKP